MLPLLQNFRTRRIAKTVNLLVGNKCSRSNPLSNTTHNCPGPPTSQCPRCSKSIQMGCLKEHIAGCKFKVCTKCSCRVFAGDLHECGRKVCSGCEKSFLEKDFPEHQLKCEVKRCWQCRKGNILKKEFLQHLQQECGKKYCWKCGKSGIWESEFTRHQQECNMMRCPNCNRRLTKDATHLCQFVRCHWCIRHVLKTEYPDHRLVFSSVLSKKRLALRQNGSCSWLQHITSTLCPCPRVDGLVHYRKHAEMRILNKQRQENTEVEKQRFWRVLLQRNGQVSRWKSSSIAESMQTWGQLPKNVAICDIEACNLGRSMSHLNVFEIAIANANGQWIIPPTIINHEITKRELFEANAGTLMNNLVFSKFYGDANETEARGNGKRTATWKELGQELESYIANEGPIVEWFEGSSYNIDWQGVYAGRASVGFERLRPLMPMAERRPLLWFRKIRAALKLENLGLNLGNLFAILYPEDYELLAQAHYAGPDVEMLSKVIKYLFASLEDSQIPRKLKNYFHAIDIDLTEINDQNDDRAQEGPATEEEVEVSEMDIYAWENEM